MFTTLISTQELAARLGDPTVVIIDVRHDLAQPDTWGAAEYGKGHVPGARFAHLDRDLSAPKSGRNGRHPLPDSATCAATFGRLGIDGSKQVVAYDQGSGMVASRLWWMLRSLGHDAVAVLDGGYAKWTREGRPVATQATAEVSTEASTSAATTFTPRRSASTVDAAKIVADLDERSLMLVDARARERYRGDVEPLDPVAGHIPGALNRPYPDNLDANGTFKSAATLNAEFASLIAGRSPAEIVHYCGSGVSACHNLLAMAHAGLAGARLYPGSWSEWCSDPLHPVERGDG